MAKAEQKDLINLKELPWARRWYVVPIGNAAENALLSANYEVSEKTIKAIIRHAKKNFFHWGLLERKAAALRTLEKEAMKANYLEQGMTEQQAENGADREIERKYTDIDLDSDRNYSFLDPILLSEQWAVIEEKPKD